MRILTDNQPWRNGGYCWICKRLMRDCLGHHWDRPAIKEGPYTCPHCNCSSLVEDGYCQCPEHGPYLAEPKENIPGRPKQQKALALWRTFGSLIQLNVGEWIYEAYPEMAEVRDELFELGEWQKW